MICKSIVAAGLVSSAWSVAASAQNSGAEPGPFVGVYFSDYTVEFIDGTPCQDILDAGFVTTCNSSQLVMVNADGTAQTADNNASPNARSDSMGIWDSPTATTFRSRMVTIYYDEDSRAQTFDVVESRSRAVRGGRGTEGTFEARNYNVGQNPFNPDEIPNFVNTGIFETKKLR
ncbi:hypothetical protein [Henriciella sp.]|uniref:hypothetical protein n=1 Tax=Henriciella sp. TaxID=1968823 RepID=UPI002610E44D|nr:hypothetical protein [Henriciella sp.]